MESDFLQKMKAELHTVAMCGISYEIAVTCYAFMKSATKNGYMGRNKLEQAL